MLISVSVTVAILTSCDSMHSHTITHESPLPSVHSLSSIGADYAWLTTKSGRLFRTTNGGKTWNITPLRPGNEAKILFFLDAKLGWMVSRKREIWHTIDSGDTWTLLTSLKNDSADDYVIPPEDIYFVDPSHGWITDPTTVWRTENGGKNWQCYYPSSNSQGISELRYCNKFATTQYGWLGGDHGATYVTSDGGKTWQANTLGSGDTPFSDAGLIESKHAWLIATDGTLYFSEDYGKAWKLQSDALNYSDCIILSAYFVSETHGWAVGRPPASYSNNHDTPHGQLSGLAFHTTNGGESWRRIIIDKDETVYWRVYFANKDQGWVIGTKKLYRTEDGGASWSVSFDESTSGG
jgi:photosystem II stability/assembly factor-like uncharacterized protein